jgi:hypothetical protein
LQQASRSEQEGAAMKDHLSVRIMKHTTPPEEMGCSWPACAWHLQDAIQRSAYLDDGRYFDSDWSGVDVPGESAARAHLRRIRKDWRASYSDSLD